MHATIERLDMPSLYSSYRRSGVTARPPVAAAKRLVLKMGTGVLTDPEGQLARSRLRRHLQAVAALVKQGRQVVLVSSGAVGVGRRQLGLGATPEDLGLRQACAAIGQSRLMSFYEQELSRHGVICGQVLLNQGDFDDRRRCLGLRGALDTMLTQGVVPILNENDAVVSEPLKDGVGERPVFSDNDRLAALVANELSCDLLLLLTDVEGVYDRDPRHHDNAQLLEQVDDISSLGDLSPRPGSTGRGGMASKVKAARIARSGGCQTVIAGGLHHEAVWRSLDGAAVGTWFPANEAMPSRNRWIAFATSPRGILHLDQGAVDALCWRQASLLPVGLQRVDGVFRRGDVVVMVGPDGATVGRGLALYDSETMRRLCGTRSFGAQLPAEQRGPNALVRRTHVVLETRLDGSGASSNTPNDSLEGETP